MLPLPAPLVQGESGGGEVVPGAGEPAAALGDTDPAGRLVGGDLGQLGLEVLEAALLLEPLGLGGVPVRLQALPALLRACFRAGAGGDVRGRPGEPSFDGGDRGLQAGRVIGLGPAGQPVLVVAAADDRARPPRRRLSVMARLRWLSRSLRTWCRCSSSRPGGTGSGRDTAARSARRSRPRWAATWSSTWSSAGVAGSRVVTAAPAGAAASLTPRHSRSFRAVMPRPR
jgi:hypothetical protein